jgi:hypothetical protein
MFAEAETAADAFDGLDADARRQLAASEDAEPEADPRETWQGAFQRAYATKDYALALAKRFARDDVDNYAGRERIDPRGLDPRSLPTFWASALAHVARIRAVTIASMSPKGKKSPGQIDLLHLKEAAAYADVFVTSDRRLRALASTVRELPCAVLATEEWIARYA